MEHIFFQILAFGVVGFIIVSVIIDFVKKIKGDNDVEDLRKMNLESINETNEIIAELEKERRVKDLEVHRSKQLMIKSGVLK